MHEREPQPSYEELLQYWKCSSGKGGNTNVTGTNSGNSHLSQCNSVHCSNQVGVEY